MLDHVTIRVSDREASERFYGTVLGAIGIGEPTRRGRYTAWGELSLADGRGGEATRHLHVALSAPSREAVDAFWQAGVDAGFRSDGEPGRRPRSAEGGSGAFLLDPDGNGVEAVRHAGMRERPGAIDHLWIRVPDLAAAVGFYELVAPFAGYRLTGRDGGRATFGWGEGRGGFTLAPADRARPPTERLHLAFAAGDEAAVHGFWRAAVAAGFRDNGGPGERPEYEPGYVGAFVLDPNGHNVEVVHRRR